MTLNPNKITIKCNSVRDISLDKINEIMKKYNTCIISGIIKQSEIKKPMKKLKMAGYIFIVLKVLSQKMVLVRELQLLVQFTV